MESTNSNEGTYSFLDNMVSQFYEFMGKVYIEYVKNKETLQGTSENNKTFAGYFLYKLFMTYGIKRRKINDEIVLMYYVKSLKNYDKNSNITQLCRHMILNLKNMRIISLGIPKGVSLDKFCESYGIDKEDLSTGVMGYNSTGKAVLKYKVFKFPEGTMVTYNPSMKKLSPSLETVHDDIVHEEDEDDESKEYKKIVDEKVQKHFEYSTRKNIGTSSFNTKKKFSEMFEENNQTSGTYLENIPEELMKDTVLVFNVEHIENYMVSNQIKNYNTLCAVYKFKNDEKSSEEFNAITNLSVENNNDENILEGFKTLGKGMVTQVHVSAFKEQVKEYVQNLYLPEVIVSFEKKNAEGKTEIIPVDTLSISQLEKIVNSKNKYFQGYIIYGFNGERSKITNTKYKELRLLKGNKPITIAPWNNKNLFGLYWRLVKEKKIDVFLKEFDFPANELSMNYVQLFTWFNKCAMYFARGLFQIYHNSFVKKTMNKPDIPFPMKPLCGELHKKYLETKVPISPPMVEEFLFSMPSSKIYWRVFASQENNNSTNQ